MKKFLLLGAALALLSGGTAEAASVSGTVDVIGHVTGTCSVQPGGGGTFGDTIDLGELDGADGKISSTLTGSTISGASKTFSVICNTGTPSVSLTATAMKDGVVSPAAGYTNTVDYKAQLDLALSPSGTSTFTFATATSSATGTSPLASPLAGTANNVTVSVNSANTDGGANTSILTQGNYGVANGGTGGVISITISP